MKIYAAIALLLASSLLLASCQSTNVKPNIKPTQTKSLTSAQSLLADSDNLTGREKAAQQLMAAGIFASLDQPQRALDICKKINPAVLDDALYAKHIQIQSQSLLMTGNVYGAKGRLEQARLVQSFTRLESGALLKIRELRFEVYSKIGDIPKAISERIALSKVRLDDSDAQMNRELIWMSLMEMDIDNLNIALASSDSSLEQGWYELAIVSKNYQSNINQQYEALNQWRNRWKKHPANHPLPADLALIDNIVNNQPKKVALLLPLSGPLAPVAEAVRDGFMAAYYTNLQNGGIAPTIHIYNTDQNSVSTQYDKAVSDGAEVIVGPLSKESITELALRPVLAVPTLVLNQIESDISRTKRLFQLGLAVEDEASDAAERAYNDNNAYAMIIAPEGAQGERAVQVFKQRFTSLGGQVVETLRFANERALSNLIKQTMHLNSSQERAKEMRGIVGKLEFEPRRRQDIDCIFLLAQPREARQIKPLLDYHYAGDIPLYSISTVYEGDGRLEPDLEGIHFSNLPWFFQSSPEKKAISKGKNLNARTQRLYALGVDAFYLYPRLEQLGSANRTSFWGQTGILSLNDYQQFERKLQWAIFRKGKVVADKVTSDIEPETLDL